MNVLAITGSGDRTAVAERLVERLGRDGSVGTVTRPDPSREDSGSNPDAYRGIGASCHYRLGDDHWTATGDARSLGDVLDELAPRCDYAVVEGFEDPALPTLVVGDGDVTDGEMLDKIPSKEQLDTEAILSGLSAVDPYETLGSLVARAKESPDSDKSGAIATFTGRVRKRDDDGDPPTEYLEFERYDGVAEQTMATIRAELEARDGVYEVLMHHRTGVVEAEEDIVFVVVLAGHRPEAFATVGDGIDRLKAEVPLFKKEVTIEETFWAHQHDHSHHPGGDGGSDSEEHDDDQGRETPADTPR